MYAAELGSVKLEKILTRLFDRNPSVFRISARVPKIESSKTENTENILNTRRNKTKPSITVDK